MKKEILFVALFLLTIFNMKSQSLEIQGGVKLQHADINYPGVEVNRKLGFDAGVFFSGKIKDSENWCLRVGLFYSYFEFGLRDGEDGDAGISYYFNEHSLKVPILLEWHTQINHLKPFIQAGVYSSYPFYGELKAYGETSDLSYKSSKDKIDYGTIAGVGVGFGQGMRLSANFDYGLPKRYIALGNEYVSVRNKGCSIIWGIEF